TCQRRRAGAVTSITGRRSTTAFSGRMLCLDGFGTAQQAAMSPFGDDFADITDAEKAKISEFLTAIKPTLSDEIDLVTRLWLADRIYALRNKDDAWRARYSRIRAVLLEEIANESRRESIALMESGLGQRDVGVETIIDQLVLARYKTCIDYSNDGDQDLTQARKAIEENAAQIGKNAVEYLHALSADIAQQMAQYKRAP